MSKSSNEIVIRPYRQADESAVVQLWRDCGLVVSWNNPVADIARKVQAQPELLLVGEIAERVVATVIAGYEGHRGWINYLAVSPDMRRHGIGQRMMGAAEEKLRSLGCPKINLQVRRTNSNVMAFYKHLGFAEDDVASLGKRLD